MSVLPDWEPPDVASSELSYAVTSSVLEEFAQGHSIADVLRELVQNEYDAHGSALSIAFSSDGLHVRGSGRVIDNSGWSRLSVMLGTGRVIGAERDVPQKTNGIGSKNHGLRALFLIGDQIYVRSGGRQTLLDLYRGTPSHPRPDPSSAGLPGVHIFVPYRSASDARLEPYDSSRRTRDIDSLATELAPTLVKLADPRSPRSLRAVNVRSVEQDRVLSWRQTVKVMGRHRAGGDVLSRMIEVRDEATGRRAAATKIAELEYRKTVLLPAEHRTRDFPHYFRVSGGRVRLGISVRIRRRRPDVAHRGSFYYPLGFAHDSTGCAISVNAPFEMNQDRSALVDPTTSSWNEWLLEAAADFALDLLTGEWFDSYGQAAYQALAGTHEPAIPAFTENLSTGLSARECWPTRARRGSLRKPLFVLATDIRIGSSASLDALPSDARRLDARLDDPRVRQMARDAGARDFTLAEAVRLRCAGSDASHLETQAEAANSLYYRNFPDALADLDLQKQFAVAFDAHARHLTKANQTDLRHAPTTLTAAGTLAAPSEPLWVVDEALASVAPVGPTQRLHPALAEFRTVKRLCKQFDISDWALDVAARASDGTVGAEDRQALYRYLIRRPEAIRRRAWPALRRSPIFRDHRDEWVAATELIHRRAAGATRLEPSLHFPSKEIGRNARLMRTLRIRSKVTGADLVRHAAIVAANPELAGPFEETLFQLRRLLTPATVARLETIAFLPSTTGGLVAPEDAYARSAFVSSCVGEEVAYASGPRTSLHSRLGCRTSPRADDITAYLETLRAADTGGPPSPQTLYPALADALRDEYGDASWHADEPILFDREKWQAPEDVLLGRKHRAIFAAAVPVVVAGELERTYERLGATREPTPAHWLQFFNWIDSRSEEGNRRLSPTELSALRLAYAKLDSLPASLPDSARVFVDSSGRLHSRFEARARTFLINDDPRTANAVADAALPIAFADPEDASTRHFYLTSGVQLLSDARQAKGFEIAQTRSAPHWFDETSELARLQKPLFAAAVYAVAVANGSRTAVPERELRRRLRDVTRITFVSTLKEIWKIGPHVVRVPADIAIEGDRIALRAVKSKPGLQGVLAHAVSRLAEATPAVQPALADSVYRLLSCEADVEVARYLEHRGVPWRHATDQLDLDDVETDEDGEPADGRAIVADLLKNQLLRKPPSVKTTPPARSTGVQLEGPSSRSSQGAAKNWSIERRSHALWNSDTQPHASFGRQTRRRRPTTTSSPSRTTGATCGLK